MPITTRRLSRCRAVVLIFLAIDLGHIRLRGESNEVFLPRGRVKIPGTGQAIGCRQVILLMRMGLWPITE
jgi:hypothetical protein